MKNWNAWDVSILARQEYMQRHRYDLLLLLYFHIIGNFNVKSFILCLKFGKFIYNTNFNFRFLSFQFIFSTITNIWMQNLHRSKFRHSPSLDNWQPTVAMACNWDKRKQYHHHQPIAQEHAQYWHHHKSRCAVQTVWFMPIHVKWRKKPASEMVLRMLR